MSNRPSKTYQVSFLQFYRARTAVEASSIEEAQSKAAAKFRADVLAAVNEYPGPSQIQLLSAPNEFETWEIKQ